MKRFDVDPVARPRQTQRDRWKKRPAVLRYHAFRDAIRLQARGWQPMAGDSYTFGIPMPRSWSQAKRRRMDGQPHEQKPDLDNLVKGLLDCWEEDKHIWRLGGLEKRWAVVGFIEARRGCV